MKTTSSSSTPAAGLRRRAEGRLRGRRHQPRPKIGAPRLPAESERLVHELQVHQVELEMQNAALEEGRERAEVMLEKFTDLYDFAPVGYFSLDEAGRILEVNLTGAALLGVERSRLIGRRLPRFVAPASQPVLLAFLGKVLAGPGKDTCTVPLLKEDGEVFWASLHGSPTLSASPPRRTCRITVADITALKEAEEARRRLEALAVKNRELEQEVVRRQAVEEALKRSEQHQTDMLERSRHMQEQLRHLSHRILQAQEEERKRISRELHDEITQTLVGISVHLAALARHAAAHPAGLHQKIARTQGLVEKSVKIVHRFARELRPATLDDLGLVPALRAFMNDFTKRTGLYVRFRACTSGWIDELRNAGRTALYRVAQEALTNVARHAQATRVEVSINKLQNALFMRIKDNGKSFEVEPVSRARQHKRLGLISMRERMEMLGGTFSIASAPGQGTTVVARLPLSRNGAPDGRLLDRVHSNP